MKKFTIAIGWLAASFAFLPTQPTVVSAQSFLDRLEQRLQQIVPTAPGEEETLPPDVGRPGYLGLVGDDVSGEGGVRVESVRPDGPAARAGLRVGDRVVELNGAPIRNLDDMARGLERQWVRSRLELQVIRNGEQRTVQVVLGERPTDRGGAASNRSPMPGVESAPGPSLKAPAVPRPPAALDPFLAPAAPLFGATLAEVSPSLQRRYGLTATAGAIVVDLRPGTPADESRLLRGALITSINGVTIRHPSDVETLLEMSQPGETWEIDYLVRQQKYATRLVLAGVEPPEVATDSVPLPPESKEEMLPFPPPPDKGAAGSSLSPPTGGSLDLGQRLGRDGRRPLLGRIGQILDDVTAGEPVSPSSPLAPMPLPPPPTPRPLESELRGEGGEASELQRLREDVRRLREEVEQLKRRLEGLERRVVPPDP